MVIDLELIDTSELPDETAITAITLAELAAGPHATVDERERGRRQDRLPWAASSWDPLPFNGEVARAYGCIYATTRASGRGTRRRLADLLIAATALAHGLSLYTRNPADFAGAGRTRSDQRGVTVGWDPGYGRAAEVLAGSPLAFSGVGGI